MRTGWSQGMVTGLEHVSKCATPLSQGVYLRSLRLEGSTGPFLLRPPIARVALRFGRWRRNLGLEQTQAGAGLAAILLGHGEKVSQEVHGANCRGAACPSGCCSYRLRVFGCRSYCLWVRSCAEVAVGLKEDRESEQGVERQGAGEGGAREAKGESRSARVLIPQSALPRL
jgi:hypothetical protein